MDNNNLRPSLPNTIDTCDWRTKLPPHSRQRIVNRIMETLKKNIPSSGPVEINELRRISARFEEKIFSGAVSQADYLQKISMKMMTIEANSQNAAGSSSSIPAANNGTPMDSIPTNQGHLLPGSLPTNQTQAAQPLMPQTMQSNTASGMTGSTALPSSMPPVSSITYNNVTSAVNQNSDMQNVAGMLQDSSGQHGLSSNMFSGPQRQMLGRSRPMSSQQPQSTQSLFQEEQLLKQNFQSGNVPNPSSLLPSHMQHQQRNQLHSSQQPGIPTSTTQPSTVNSSPLQGLHTNQQSSPQLSGQQTTQSMLRQHQSSLLRSHPQSQQASGMHQQQTSLLQQTQTMRRQAGHGLFSSQGQQQTQNQPSQQQMMPQLQSHHQQLGLQQQPNLIQQDVQQRLQVSGQVTGSLLPPQNVVDQQRQLNQSQRTLPEMPSSSRNSRAQTENADGGDWQEEVYQKIMSMKQAYLPDLNKIYQRVASKLQLDSLPQQQRSDQFEKLKQFRAVLERMIQFLSVSKRNIMPLLKDKVADFEKQIIDFLNMHRLRTIHQGQPPQSQMQQPVQQPQSQTIRDHSHDSQRNQQMQSMSMQGSGPRAQQSSLTNMQNNVLSSRPGVSAPQQKIPSSIPGSSLESGQGNALNNGQGQRATYPLQQLKPGSQLSVSSPQLLQGASPRMTQQHMSPKVNQKNLPSVNKMGTPLQSANSPFVVPSPATPLAPSSMQADSERPSSLSMGNTARQQATGMQGVVQSLAIGTPGISASPLLQECTSPDGNNLNPLTSTSGKPSATELPIERLIRAVKSISPQALSAAVSDIGSVVSMVDRIAGSAPGNSSRASVGEDLVAMTKCHLQARNFTTEEGMMATKKRKRDTTAMPLSIASLGRSAKVYE